MSCWIVDLLKYLSVDVQLLKCWIDELLNCWSVELLSNWSVWVLKCWSVKCWSWSSIGSGSLRWCLKMKFEVESTNWNWYLGFEVCIQKLKYHKFVFNNWSIISIVRRLWYISVSLENILFCLGLVSLFVLKCLLRFLLPE